MATTPARHLVPKGTLAKPELSVRRAKQGVPVERDDRPAGALAAISIIASAALKSAPDPGVGTVLVAKTTCPAGKILLSGGARSLLPAFWQTATWSCAPRFPSHDAMADGCHRHLDRGSGRGKTRDCRLGTGSKAQSRLCAVAQLPVVSQLLDLHDAPWRLGAVQAGQPADSQLPLPMRFVSDKVAGNSVQI